MGTPIPSSEAGKASRMLYLDVARVVAIFLVCLNHAVNRSYSNYSNQMAEFLSTPQISTLFKTLCTVASFLGVPIYLMISGVLLFRKPMNSTADIKKFYKNNLLTIFIVTEIWYAIMYWFLVIFTPEYQYILDKGFAHAVFGMVKTMLFVDQVTLGSMWYMPMILCVYLTVPFVIIIKDKLQSDQPSPVLFLPLVVLYLSTMVLPALNALQRLNGYSELYSAINLTNLFSKYYIYIFVGYFVGQGLLSKWSSWALALSASVLFGLCCWMQYFAYSQPAHYLMDYTFPLLPFCAAFLFELFRRIAPFFRKTAPLISYISRIAFGIYFVHIVIMTILTLIMGNWDLIRPLRVIIYQLVSFFGSIVVIFPLSKIPLLRKYLFMYK